MTKGCRQRCIGKWKEIRPCHPVLAWLGPSKYGEHFAGAILTIHQLHSRFVPVCRGASEPGDHTVRKQQTRPRSSSALAGFEADAHPTSHLALAGCGDRRPLSRRAQGAAKWRPTRIFRLPSGTSTALRIIHSWNTGEPRPHSVPPGPWGVQNESDITCPPGIPSPQRKPEM